MNLTKIKTYLEMGRASNLPTCISNISVGYFLVTGSFSLISYLAAILSAICFYEAGMFCNDILDYQTDLKENRGRPLALKKLTMPEAVIAMLVLFSIGFILLWTLIPKALPVGIFLLLSILIYNQWHKNFIGSPVFMGACRASLYWIGAIAAGWSFGFDFVFYMSLVLWVYIALVTLIARDEIKSEANHIQKISSILSLIVASAPLLILQNPISILVYLPLALWIFKIIRGLFIGTLANGPAVGKLLSAISLLDAWILACFQFWPGVILSWLCFGLTHYFHKKIRGT